MIMLILARLLFLQLDRIARYSCYSGLALQVVKFVHDRQPWLDLARLKGGARLTLHVWLCTTVRLI